MKGEGDEYTDLNVTVKALGENDADDGAIIRQLDRYRFMEKNISKLPVDSLELLRIADEMELDAKAQMREERA